MPSQRSVTVGGVAYPVRLPNPRDPRLHLAATIISIQALGQVALDFEISIAQILVCLLTCAAIEVTIGMRAEHVIAWPASAMLTGNGVALVLRYNGTEHGDWWSLEGWYVFAATAAFALLSKYALTFRGRPLINPSNLGLVACFLILGTGIVNPLDFWWAPWSPRLALVYAVLLAGALVVTRRLGLLPMSLAFWATFSTGLGLLAATGHCFAARWSITTVCGQDLWGTVVTSPEVLIFMLFMITDPVTTPRSRGNRVLFGMAVGLTSALLVSPWTSEFGAKVGVLSGLVVVCAVRPLAVRVLERGRLPTSLGSRAAWVGGVAVLMLGLTVGAGALAPGPPATSSATEVGGRPDVDIDPLPPVTVAPEVDALIEALTGSSGQARDMAADLAEGLAIEATATVTDDPALAATAMIGTRLLSFDSTGSSAPYDFTSMTVVVVRDPTNPQAIPRLGIRAGGVRDESAFDSVFVLQDAGGTWLIEDELTPQQAGIS